MKKFRHVRWSGSEDRYFGPFTFCSSPGYRKVALMISSGTDNNPLCFMRMSISKWTFLIVLPSIIKPFKEWVDTSKYTWSDNPKGGYWDYHEREYGFTYSEKSLHVHYGAQTDCWPRAKSKVFFIPWLSWRHVRTSHYNHKGEHYHTEPKGVKWGSPERQTSEDIIKQCPVIKFAFTDYDGQQIIATTSIVEREYRLGEGYFKWLSVFAKSKIHRSLSIEFSAEVGREKGSWKGGTLGHGIEMLKGELHEQAFKRYCEEDHYSKSGNFKINYIGEHHGQQF